MVLLLFFFDHRGLSCRDVNGGRRGAFDVVGRLEWTNQSEGATPTNQRRDNGAVSSGLGSPRPFPSSITGFLPSFFCSDEKENNNRATDDKRATVRRATDVLGGAFPIVKPPPTRERIEKIPFHCRRHCPRAQKQKQKKQNKTKQNNGRRGPWPSTLKRENVGTETKQKTR